MPGATFLEGDNVELKTIEEEDLELLQEMGNNPELRKYSPGGTPVNMNQQRKIFEEFVSGDDNIFLLICTDEPVGWINLKHIDKDSGKAELGVRILPEHQENGYGTEASELLIEHGFDQLRLHRIYGRTFDFNQGSKKLMEKLGFEREGVHREEEFKDGEYRDVAYYSILKEEW